MTLVIFAALVGAASVLSARAAGRKVATAEVPVLAKSGEQAARRQRRNA